MSSDPYAPPESNIEIESNNTVPLAVLKKIKAGWIAALISGLFTAIVMVLAMTSGTMAHIFGIWSAIDVALILGLAVGIYKKSRVAASTMFLYFLASKIWIMSQTGRPSGLLISLIFLYFYFQAMVATFQYHKIIAAK